MCDKLRQFHKWYLKFRGSCKPLLPVIKEIDLDYLQFIAYHHEKVLFNFLEGQMKNIIPNTSLKKLVEHLKAEQ